MTGVTTELAPWQVKELTLYASPGEVRTKPSANLLRRGLVMRVGPHGRSHYILTEFGRSILRLHTANEDPYSIPEDAVYPRDAEHRYRIYARHGSDLEILAVAGSPEAFGVALVQLDKDERERGRRLVDLGAIGVLDAVEGRWIILPWHRPDDTPLFQAALDRASEMAKTR